MKMQWRSLSIMILAILLLGSVVYTYARGGRGFRGGGGFAHREGGFSREGPAAGGGFASRSGLMEGRQQFGQRALAGRQQEANGLLSNRQQLARRWQSRAEQRRGYPYWAGYPGWDAGAGLAALGAGAAIGAAAGSSTAYPSASGSGYSAAQPCANAVVAPGTGVTYYNCGAAWYTKAYGPNGPVFVAVNRPPGL